MLMDRLDARRHAVAIMVALSAGLCAGTGAHAAAPMAKGQAPGYYRMMLGDFEVTAVSDGTVDLEVAKLLTRTTPALAKQALRRAFLDDPVETSVNAYLVNTGAKLVLIDAGAGKLFGPTLGGLVASLKAAGYQPEQVDEIYVTHMHSDHVGGLAEGGKAVFPNAVVRADRRDADFWLSQKTLDAAAKDDKGFIEGAMASLKPYVDAGRFTTFDAKNRYWVAAAHLPFPGIGHLRAEGRGYVFVPANYSVPR